MRTPGEGVVCVFVIPFQIHRSLQTNLEEEYNYFRILSPLQFKPPCTKVNA
jgi:hypothetical protein